MCCVMRICMCIETMPVMSGGAIDRVHDDA